MFARQDQKKLLNYLAKKNSPSVNKNVIKSATTVPQKSAAPALNKRQQIVSIPKLDNTETTTNNAIDVDDDKSSAKVTVVKQQDKKRNNNDNSSNNNNNNNSKNIPQKRKNEEESEIETKKSKKIKQKLLKKEKMLKAKQRTRDAAAEVPALISEKKAEKIKREGEEDSKLASEIQAMWDQFKKETEENPDETIDDIEADIRENEGFVEDDEDAAPSAAPKNEFEKRSSEVGSKAKQQLAVSMFRSMNEYLYTHTSGDSRKEFTANKFKMYHDAYNTLMQDWPIKPVDFLRDVLEKRIAKTAGTAVIADVGCGSRPQIADAFPQATVHSFDLYQEDLTDSRIMCADMCRLPLDSEICDFVVYSLSLMPTNLRDAFKEANRILKMGGTMLIVEVASRFADFQSSSGGRVQNVPEKHVGQRFTRELKNFGFQLMENEELQPNGYFVYFSFKKTESVENTPKAKLPELTLKACAYKPR